MKNFHKFTDGKFLWKLLIENIHKICWQKNFNEIYWGECFIKSSICKIFKKIWQCEIFVKFTNRKYFKNFKKSTKNYAVKVAVVKVTTVKRPCGETSVRWKWPRWNIYVVKCLRWKWLRWKYLDPSILFE